MGNFLLGDGVKTARVSHFYRRDTWIEGRAAHQLETTANMAGMRAVAAFPDLHPGRHGPIGAAFLADRIYPQLIGPDIGCGMALFRLDLPRRRLKLDKAARRMRLLEQPETHAGPEGLAAHLSPAGLGTIGGGNHFCELQVVQTSEATVLKEGELCLLVHSGSRSAGAAIFGALEARWNDGFLTGSREALDYLHLHDAAVAWAKLNRRLIARTAAKALRCDLSLICDAVHNHVAAKGDNWLHRKGAAEPDRGFAPLAGSRETLSYLLACDEGPEDALGSLSHGAGRRYDRSSMHGRVGHKRSDRAAMHRNRFGGQVICEDRNLLIEEAGHAYKDPATVVADLVHFGIARPVAELAPLITYKCAREERS